MYQNLGVQRASSILAGLATGCAVLPILFWKFGPAIRSRCRFAKEAARVMLLMKENENENSEGGDKDEKPKRPSIESEKRRDSQEKSEDIEAQR